MSNDISMNAMKLIIKSPKVVEFYQKNPHFDINNINELFIDIIQKLTSFAQNTISVNEVKTLLHTINNKMNGFEDNLKHNNQIVQMTYENMNQHKDYYIESMKRVLENNDNEQSIISSIKTMNENIMDKMLVNVLQQFPKMNDSISQELKQLLHIQQNEIIQETQRNLQGGTNVEQLLQDNYQNVHTKMQNSLHQYFQSHEMNVMGKLSETQMLFQTIGKDFQSFLEKQKNSTLKGKESEEKLESCLVCAFPHGNIKCQSGMAQCCDFILTRQDKPDILFENKDYINNVPHEEIKKFIRDIEYQNKHGIMLSQHSGITQKQDYQIDIHGGNIMVFVHFVKYDESKLRVAVNLIDHLDGVLKAHVNETGTSLSMEQASEINKEYLTFIGQKKNLIEMTKKMQKEQLKALEEFEMPKLTHFLNSLFTNVEQFNYKCEICGVYSAKNKRALVTHQNKCKKKHATKQHNQCAQDSSANSVIDLSEKSETIQKEEPNTLTEDEIDALI